MKKIKKKVVLSLLGSVVMSGGFGAMAMENEDPHNFFNYDLESHFNRSNEIQNNANLTEDEKKLAFARLSEELVQYSQLQQQKIQERYRADYVREEGFFAPIALKCNNILTNLDQQIQQVHEERRLSDEANAHELISIQKW